jgi:hypothetical protein
MGTAWAGEAGEWKCAGLLVSESLLVCSVFYLRDFYDITYDVFHAGVAGWCDCNCSH